MVCRRRTNGGLLLCAGLFIVLTGSTVNADDADLARRVSSAKKGATVPVGGDVSTQPLVIRQSVAIQGNSADTSILEVTTDRPAISVTDKAKVTIENVTIKWQLDTSEPEPGPPSAVWVKDADLTLKNCKLIALGNGKRCPSGMMADGFSKLTLENCTLEGFEFAVNVSGGAEATAVDCVIRKPGHCGLSVFSGSTLVVRRCIVAESLYHGLRSTGGTLTAADNLILHNKNRGIYLGNKSATATIRGNVFLANATGISSFAQSAATIEGNVFLDNQYAAIDSRDTCLLTIDGNILQENERGVVLYSDSGEHHLALGTNTLYNNRIDAEGIDLPEETHRRDPLLEDREHGRFVASAEAAAPAKQGLADADPLARLWSRWESIRDSN